MRNIISYRTTALVHHRTLQILMFYSKPFKAFIHGNTGGRVSSHLNLTWVGVPCILATYFAFYFNFFLRLRQ